MKHVAIIGSTGSIGTQTLEIARWNQDIKICALSAGRNIDLLEKQAREFRPEIVGLWDEKLADELKDRLKDMDIRVVSGMYGLIDIAEYFHVSMDYLLLGRDPSRDQFQNELQAAIDHLEKIKGLL